ncbi:glutamate--cysteine ligase [Streptomyces bambusae]|uniref:carboxylate-amine ligase n=1 Tax=Streptomyces bambusae TaxID=1550616 RepID=UPI001CFFBD70|nr:glutamate--cysteine ligase [Streptomyces bambusae]MCB5169128.1 glutamate--cysteine ligase [Streptomyces bambusae]
MAVHGGSGTEGGSAVLTVGVEEEYLLVDPVTRQVSPQAPKVVADAAAHGLGDRVGVELTCYQVEVRTRPHRTMADLGEEVRSLRAAVAAAAGRQGHCIVSTGTPVLGQATPPPLTPGPRYARSFATFRALDDEQTVCACHVHIGIPDVARALSVANHLRPWLPALIALTANSPYWQGRDTGYAGWRTMALSRWPVAGPPPYVESPAHFDELVAALVESGAVMDRGGLYWDIRPSSHVPTLEFRIADACATADGTVLLAALVRAMAATALAAVDAGDPAGRPRPELLRAACWRAARDGLRGHAVDLPGSRLIPATEQIERLLSWVRPALHRHGDLELVRTLWARVRAGGGGADLQRAAHRRHGRVTDVVDHLIAAATRTG